MEKLYCVYRHTSPSGKVYIGITSKKNPEHRWNKGKNYRNSVYFSKAIKKYGWENIKHEILFSNLKEECAKNLEISLIRHYKNLGISYNITDGGEGVTGLIMSDEGKLKRRHTILTKYTKEQRQEWARKAGASSKPKYKRALGFKRGKYIVTKHKAISQYTLDGTLIRHYNSVNEAVLATGVKQSNISRCATGVVKTAGKYIWKYE